MIAQIALVTALLFPQARTPIAIQGNDPWLSPDKAKHFLIAGFVEAVGFSGLEAMGVQRNSALVGAIGLTGAVSVIRELHDSRTKNQFSFRDLTWDLAGGVAAYLVLRHTERP